jgi:hypothetical protein
MHHSRMQSKQHKAQQEKQTNDHLMENKPWNLRNQNQEYMKTAPKAIQLVAYTSSYVVQGEQLKW